MRNPTHIFVTLLAIALLGACSKQETATASAEASPAPAAQPATAAIDSPEPGADDVATESATAPEATQDAAVAPSTQPVAQATSSLPPPMLPRRVDASAVTEKPDPAVTQRIAIADAYEIMRAGDGVLVDVRNADAYQFQRIPGALSIPLGEVAGRAGELPQDKWIITYCTCPAEESSGAAASTLSNMGFPRVAALLGGMQGWRAANLPMELGQ